MRNNISITKSESLAISNIRAISAIMIVLCHIFQGLSSEWAWWFNVGVQIFLCMSGFLMAKDAILNKSNFIKKRFSRILIPYYLVVLITILLYFIIKVPISKENVITYLFAYQGVSFKNIIPGLEHLWFISMILICYIATLFLNKLRSNIKDSKGFIFYPILTIALIGLQIIVNSIGMPIFYGARFGAFLLGYCIACRYEFKVPNKLFWSITILTLIIIPIRIYYTYFNLIDSENLKIMFNRYFVSWSHTLLGVFIFIFLYKLFSSFYENKQLKSEDEIKSNYLLQIVSDYSYEIYLTHQIFILGPSSLLFVTKSVFINILIIFLVIIMSTILINRLSKFIFRILKS